MLDILLFLLKFIGGILLGGIGLVVAILVIVLLVPIRYRLLASHGNQVHVDGTVSWILHILRGKFVMEGEKKRIWIRIFGILVYDSTRPKKPKKVKEKRLLKKKKRKKSSKGPKENRITSAKSRISDKRDKDSVSSKLSTNHKKHISNESDIETPNRLLNAEENQSQAEAKKCEETSENPDIKQSGIVKEKVKQIKLFLLNLKNWIFNFKKKIVDLYHKLITMKNKVGKIKEFLEDEENKLALGIGLRSLKDILLHLKPTKLESRVRFGTGDPCSTGQVLGVAGLLYGIYGDHIKITPDFEEKVFEGNHSIKGRIRIGTLLIIVIKLIIGKEFKMLKENIKILKEAL